MPADCRQASRIKCWPDAHVPTADMASMAELVAANATRSGNNAIRDARRTESEDDRLG